MNLISRARYSSGIQSSVSTSPPAWTYSRNSCSRAFHGRRLPAERSLAWSVSPLAGTSSPDRPPASSRRRATTARRWATSRRPWACRRARSTRSPSRSRSCSTRRCARARRRSTPGSTRSPRTPGRARRSASRCARTCASSRSSSTWRRSSSASGAISRASGASRSSSERRRYEERLRGLFRDGREHGELRTDLDESAAALLVLSAANWAYTWLTPGRDTDALADSFAAILVDGIRGYCRRTGVDRG